MSDSGKRCFAYCGDDRCTCDAAGFDGRLSPPSPFVAAAVLGNRVAKIPDGSYWLVECHSSPEGCSHPLYWMDDYDSSDRTGFSYIPQHAALFRTREDAVVAWAARGVIWPSKPHVLFCDHLWGDAPCEPA